MIYRRWSLLSSTVAIWGGAAAAGIAMSYLSCGKDPHGGSFYGLEKGKSMRERRRGHPHIMRTQLLALPRLLTDTASSTHNHKMGMSCISPFLALKHLVIYLK